ncbi:MAG TPA: right-handed parallel beta-helix repeat-containing protein, partial [Polyangiaceae bacterium]|nr:right-handed parallel beta-helix repeat-containing protein [Polyangiaceae bacterium]
GGVGNGGVGNGGVGNGGVGNGGVGNGGVGNGGVGNGGVGSGGVGGTGGNVCPEGSTGTNCATCVVYVSQLGGSDTNSGQTWAAAKVSLQAGVDAAFAQTAACDVWVAKGSYVPTYKADPFAAAKTATLLMRTGVALYGGFGGGELSLSARNVKTNVTTITGEIGTSAASDNLTHVVTSANGAKLDGFTVTRSSETAIVCGSGTLTIDNCTLTANQGTDSGGALNVTGTCSAKVANSNFTSNLVSGSVPRGAGIYVEGTGSLLVDGCSFSGNSGGALMSFIPVQIRNTSFENNTTSDFGASAYVVGGGTTTIDNCIFKGNKGGAGPAITTNTNQLIVRGSTFSNNAGVTTGAIKAGSLTVEDSTFTGNSAINPSGITAAGGAIYATGTVKIKRTSFNDNSVTAGNGSYGGALYCGPGCSATLATVTFHNNTAFGTGATSTYGTGGAISFNGSTMSLVNAEFTANRSRMGGGALHNGGNSASQLTVTSSTFYGNSSAAGSGGAIYNDAGSSTLLNSIFWGNTAFMQGNQVFNNGSATSTVRSSDVQGSGFSTNGNIDQDPLFASTVASALDLKLQSASPCKDHGGNADLPVDVLDLDGDNDASEVLPFDIDGTARVKGAIVDIGAHEAP